MNSLIVTWQKCPRKSYVVFGWGKITLEEFLAALGQSPLVRMLSMTEASSSISLLWPHSVLQETHAMLSSPLQPAGEEVDRQSQSSQEGANLTKTHSKHCF